MYGSFNEFASRVGAKQSVHWFLGGKGVGIRQGASVWVALPKSKEPPIHFWGQGQPTHTLFSCWMTTTLPPRNQCTDCFALATFFGGS